MKINKDNFNIILCSEESDSNNFIEMFDTIYCDINTITKFRIAIMYSLYSEEPIKSINLKGRIIYLGSGNSDDMKYQDIMDERIYLAKSESKKGKIIPNDINGKEIQVPNGARNGYGGVYNINYSVAFPEYGNYQIDLYYYKNEEEDYVFAGVVPFTVCKKESSK